MTKKEETKKLNAVYISDEEYAKATPIHEAYVDPFSKDEDPQVLLDEAEKLPTSDTISRKAFSLNTIKSMMFEVFLAENITGDHLISAIVSASPELEMIAASFLTNHVKWPKFIEEWGTRIKPIVKSLTSMDVTENSYYSKIKDMYRQGENFFYLLAFFVLGWQGRKDNSRANQLLVKGNNYFISNICQLLNMSWPFSPEELSFAPLSRVVATRGSTTNHGKLGLLFAVYLDSNSSEPWVHQGVFYTIIRPITNQYMNCYRHYSELRKVCPDFLKEHNSLLSLPCMKKAMKALVQLQKEIALCTAAKVSMYAVHIARVLDQGMLAYLNDDEVKKGAAIMMMMHLMILEKTEDIKAYRKNGSTSNKISEDEALILDKIVRVYKSKRATIEWANVKDAFGQPVIVEGRVSKFEKRNSKNQDDSLSDDDDDDLDMI